MLLTVAVLLVVAAVTTATLVLFVWWKQERIVFQPTVGPHPEVSDVERVAYSAEDGQSLFAFVIQAPEQMVKEKSQVAGPHLPSLAALPRFLIAFHGNADLAAWVIPWGKEVARRTGRVVILAEYRGYGGLSGIPSVAGARLDARAAFGFTRDSLGATPREIALYGHSLGSAIAAELAAEIKPGVLILESPFTSARAMARIVVARPIELVWGMISRVHYDTEARVQEIETPVWVAHGTRDMVIPVRMGQRVYRSARKRGEFLAVSGAGHNDVAEVAGDSYWQWIMGALGQNDSYE
ncbi:MAG: alpha/beta hydrolase [Anaerolineae bacterium]|nr:alpha/beta hydrolase [Gemmatimonadaceae bacterium]